MPGLTNINELASSDLMGKFQMLSVYTHRFFSLLFSASLHILFENCFGTLFIA
jgi:hypothetical protein